MIGTLYHRSFWPDAEKEPSGQQRKLQNADYEKDYSAVKEELQRNLAFYLDDSFLKSSEHWCVFDFYQKSIARLKRLADW